MHIAEEYNEFGSEQQWNVNRNGKYTHMNGGTKVFYYHLHMIITIYSICVSISQRANEAPVSGLRQPTPYFQRGKTFGVDAHTPLAPAQHSGICQRSWMGCLCLLVPACTLSWPLSTCCLAWFVYHQADPLPFKEEGSTSGNAPCYRRSAEEPQSALLWPVSYKYPLISETVVNKYGHKYFI